MASIFLGNEKKTKESVFIHVNKNQELKEKNVSLVTGEQWGEISRNLRSLIIFKQIIRFAHKTCLRCLY